ncbi:hypothetical protein [Kordia sp.]|uniref:hypothetical protein n=1 Tax=Kordia sp. TaxID=1965332 RepID=UPI003D6A92A4
MEKEKLPIFETVTENEPYVSYDKDIPFGLFGFGAIRSMLNPRYGYRDVEKTYFRPNNLRVRSENILSLLNKGKINKARKTLTKLSKEAFQAKKALYYDIQAKEKIDNSINDLAEKFALKCMLKEFLKEQKKKKKSSKFNMIIVVPFLGKSEDELYETLGSYVSKNIKEIYFASKLQVLLLSKGKDIYFLGSGKNIDNEVLETTQVEKENISFGKKLFNILKKNLYNIICGDENKTTGAIFDLDKIRKLIFLTLKKIGITSSPIIGSISALALLFGVDKFCERTKS